MSPSARRSSNPDAPRLCQATLTAETHLDSALDDTVAAALYVVSHHVVTCGQITLAQFAAIAHGKGNPVIVDAASEYDLTGLIGRGADLVVYSGHNFLGGPTSGIIAGRSNLVCAAYLQNIGFGRAMKVGKENIAGVIAAMEHWMEREKPTIRAREPAALDPWLNGLRGLPGSRAEIMPDPDRHPA